MRRYIIALAATALLSGPSLAQTGQSTSHNPVVKNGSPHPVAAPAKGANSFTENQARGRLVKAGYSGIGKLTKQDGLWQTSAMKGGKRMTVMLDYKGNVTAR